MTELKVEIREPNYEGLNKIESPEDLETAKFFLREVACFKSPYESYKSENTAETTKLIFFYGKKCYIDNVDMDLLYSISYNKFGGWEIGFDEKYLLIEIMKNSLNRVIKVYSTRTIEIRDEHNVRYLNTNNNSSNNTEKKLSKTAVYIKKAKTEKHK